MEKKLINSDEIKFNRQKDVFLKNLEILNQIGEKYKALGIGLIDIERVAEIISGNFSSIEADVIKAVSKEAKNSLVKDFIKTGTFESLENFQIEVSLLNSKFDRNQYGAMGIVSTPLKYYTVNSGKFSITDDAWQQIKNERCSNFISTEKELKLFEALQRLATATNEFMDCVGENAKLHYFPQSEPSDFIILNPDGLFEPDPETDYQILTQ